MAHVEVNGITVAHGIVRVPPNGPWVADITLADQAPGLTAGSRAELAIGPAMLHGTVANATGEFGLQHYCRIVAGAGGWGNTIAARSYHNDAGIKAFDVAADAARACGESIGLFTAPARLGSSYSREAARASAALEYAAAGTPWWVDYNGVTHVTARQAVTIDDPQLEVIKYDPLQRVAELQNDDISKLPIGGTLTAANLAAPLTIAELRIVITVEQVSVLAWCSASAASGRIAEALKNIAEHASIKRFGVWRYRVYRMNGSRAELQIVNAASGLPDVVPCDMWPGLPGAHAELTPGAEVLVQFEGGDLTKPVITHFVGKGGPGHAPVSVTLGGDTETAVEAAYKGASVEILLPPMVFNGVIGVVPASGVLAAMSGTTLGTIISGSSKVKVTP